MDNAGVPPEATLSADGLMALIRQRRSIRRFLPRPVEPALIAQLLEAAHWAPSAHNRQPWRFVVVADTYARRSLADNMADRLAADLRAAGVGEVAITQDTKRSRQRLIDAPALILVCLTMSDMDHYADDLQAGFEHIMAIQSAAMAAQNLLLMAHALGLGACWLCAPLFCADVPVTTLNLPDNYEAQGVIITGYPAETRQKNREPLESRVINR